MFLARRLRKLGLPAEATVKSMVPRSSHRSDSLSRMYDYVLEVRPANGAVFEARLAFDAAYLGAKPHEYDEVRVKYDPKSHKVMFDLVGDERFDTDAMNARSARLRKETAEMLATRRLPRQ